MQSFFRARRLWRALLVALLAPLMLAGTLLFTQTALAAEPISCDTASTQCVQFNIDNSLQPTATVNSGDPVALAGTHWKANQPYQVWLSVPFSVDHTWPLNTDSQSEGVVSNECHIFESNGFIDASGNFAITFAAPDVSQPTLFNVEVGSPIPGCDLVPNAPRESQGFDLKLIVNPAPRCTAQVGVPCVVLSPDVVYPGQPVSVTGSNFDSTTATSVDIYLTSDAVNAPCQVLAQNTALNAPPSATDLTNFSTTITAPPVPTLGTAPPTNGVYTFYVVAVAPHGACGGTGAVQTGIAKLYVSPPSISVTSQAHSGDTITISGQHWLAGSPATGGATPAPQTLSVGIFVGNGCSSPKTTLTTNADGSFSYSYVAENVSSATNEPVLVVSPASACAKASDPTCQQSQAGASSGCPVMAATDTLKILPFSAPTINWQTILLPLAALLLLLPLAFLLGRRDENEVILTEQDVTVEREVLNATAPTTAADAQFARTIRITRQIVNVRTGKIKDEQIEEYDVFRDAQGREVRRLRPPTTTPSPVPNMPPPATPPNAAGATNV